MPEINRNRIVWAIRRSAVDSAIFCVFMIGMAVISRADATGWIFATMFAVSMPMLHFGYWLWRSGRDLPPKLRPRGGERRQRARQSDQSDSAD
jgi:hypothetical protein